MTIQRKLKIGAPNDKFEQEADRVADEVMRMPELRPATADLPGTGSAQSVPTGGTIDPVVQRVCTECEEEDKLRRSPMGSRLSRPISALNGPLPSRFQVRAQIGSPLIQRMCPECEDGLHRQPMEEQQEEQIIRAKEISRRTPKVTPDVQAQIDGMRASGQPLPESVRVFFEPRFGYDFTGVRLHPDFGAASAASQVNARAFTVGRDIVFGTGQYAPGKVAGKSLMAHELTHVLQQQNTTTPSLQRLTEVEKAENLKSPKYAGNGRLERAFDNDPPLGIGETNDAVRLVQEGLVAAGFRMSASTKPTGELDGGFGAETFRTVQEFQLKYAHEGLLEPTGRPDGYVGRLTMGKLDELALKGPPPSRPPGKPTIPKGAVPPTLIHMSGTFAFAPRPRNPSVDVPEIFLGPTLVEEAGGKKKGGINFRAGVTGGMATRGWVFYVQNIRNHVVTIRLRRRDRQKDCGYHLGSPALDELYPYDRKGIRFKGAFITHGFLTTTDSPNVFGFAQETFQRGDEMNLSTSQQFRMFLAWDPRETPKPPSISGARPISLGFVDWEWSASGTFEADSSLVGILWHLRAMQDVSFKRSPMQTTAVGIVLDPIITGDILGRRLRTNCAASGL
ncbi:MAG: DUF4157 domain-containing protein [Phycisphaerales bacterium]|nr:MAG: DUF4157 domain-containing protein [Phycisphaerales bacterium]